MCKINQLSNDMVWDLCLNLKEKMIADESVEITKNTMLYGLPSDGIPITYLLSGMLRCGIANTLGEADILIYSTLNYKLIDAKKPYFALIDQSDIEVKFEEKFVFPWNDNNNIDTVINPDQRIKNLIIKNTNFKIKEAVKEIEKLQKIITKLEESDKNLTEIINRLGEK